MTQEMKVIKDGNEWAFVLPDFVNLQESKACWTTDGDITDTLDNMYKHLVSVPDPEPRRLWGMQAQLVMVAPNCFRMDYFNNRNGLRIIMPMSPTDLEAILAWNKIAAALEGVTL